MFRFFLLCSPLVLGFANRPVTLSRAALLQVPYSQEEADLMVSVEKLAPAVQENRGTGAVRPGEDGFTFSANGVGYPQISYVVEVIKAPERCSTVYLLKGRIGERPLEGLCSYHIHNGHHKNPPDFPPIWIATRKPHKHVYNEKAYKQRNVWCAVAYALEATRYGNPASLWAGFLTDMKISFEERDGPSLFHEVTR